MNILNIVNFVRGFDLRQQDLYTSVIKQYELAIKYDLPTTFLFQHNALFDKKFLEIVKPTDKIEVGLWIELNQEQVEEAGGVWRGREGYAWDWHSQASMMIGYKPELRGKIIDVAMEKFKDVFGYYPKTVGAWSFDAVSYEHLEKNYDISAAFICKEQWGTDGYSLWGGYYNQAFYPSRNNAFCPANDMNAQISIPVFRMLGCDPVEQYFCEEDDNGQNVVSLEPVYPESGANKEWVKWFFREMFNNKCLSFGYTQAGQENSFGWDRMSNGYTMQMEYINELKNSGLFTVMTAGEAGNWYKKNYAQTPASSIVAKKDDGRFSIWYSCKNYRTNLYFNKEITYFQDLFIFDSNYKERYLDALCNSADMYYDNLPIIDSYRCSKENRAGGYFCIGDTPIKTIGEISTREIDASALEVSIPTEKEPITVTCFEDKLAICTSCNLVINWDVCNNNPQKIADGIKFTYNEYEYSVKINCGNIDVNTTDNKIVISPKGNEIIIELKK